ncbi:MAG: TetR/AcrR family transcriptional regulator [bacterium]|nr:TetR/AcrR family transcriptional regulator [bacterium]
MARKPADQSVSREAIIWAAAEVLRRSGYEAATMKDIAAAVNLTAASLYHHFRNKDALMLAVLEAGLDIVMQQVEPIAYDSALNADAKLRTMIAAHIGALTQNTAVAAAMVFEIRTLMSVRIPQVVAVNGNGRHGDESDFMARRDAFFARRAQFERLFSHVIREGIDRRIFRPVDVPIFTKALLGAHNWVGVWYKPEGRLDGAGIAERTADYFLAALRPL